MVRAAPKEIRLPIAVVIVCLSVGLFASVLLVVGMARLLLHERSDLAYHSARGNNDEIYLLDFNRGLERNLTRNAAWDAAPARSPDGSHVAFASLRDGNQEIYVLNVADGQVQRLTTNDQRDTNPAWSPDGRQIAFASDRTGNWDIYVMDANGSNVRQLTDDPSNDDEPAWSPDGSKLAFVSYRYRNWAVYLMNPDGSDVQIISDWRVRNLEPAWSPDGTSLIVTSDPYTKNFELYSINLTDDNQTRLTSNSTWDAGAIWVDDRHIIFHSTRDDNVNPELYMMDANGEHVRRLTFNNARDSDPS